MTQAEYKEAIRQAQDEQIRKHKEYLEAVKQTDILKIRMHTDRINEAIAAGKNVTAYYRGKWKDVISAKVPEKCLSGEETGGFIDVICSDNGKEKTCKVNYYNISIE